MATHKMKLDYTQLLENIGEVISNSRSKIARENRFGIEVGLNLLTSYIKQIAERAIQLNDEVLIELLLAMSVIERNYDNES